jgi:hypothetical protein
LGWQPPPAVVSRSNAGSWIVALLLVFVFGSVGLWSTGALDRPLSEIGLNKNDCIQNAFGTKFCGDEATRYCENTRDLRELADQPRDVCDEIR